ncbi:MAG: 6-phosphogluconolactonase [Chitinophagaceae bacterium]
MNQLKVFKNKELLAKAAADFILAKAKKSVRECGRFSLVLSGGNTPQDLYGLLSREPFYSAMPWLKTFIFWGDERYVPRDDSRNNAGQAQAILLNKVPIPVENIFPILTEGAPKTCADAYQKSVLDFFGDNAPSFDFILLGLGENGHTASLFPSTEVLKETRKLVSEVYVAEQEMYRITMTVPLINQAKEIVFLVSGASKHAVLKHVLQSTSEAELLPATLIHPTNGSLLWMADSAAADEN